VRDHRWQELTDAECRRLLGERHLGRLALVDAGGPVIFPVNYAFAAGTVVFRTDPGGKLDAVAGGAVVAFEVDAVEERSRTGWSVVVRGRAGEVSDPAELERLRALPLYPWGAGREGPVRPGPSGLDHRPAHRDPGRPAVHLVGLTGDRLEAAA
jgi:nitroimidazol reductase NimA-like FMN-containing flavoprotein (pyridoxamine 5'-phosphate oxidase superfamily)